MTRLHPHTFIRAFALALLALFVCAGCTPRQKGAAAQGFYVTGRGAFSVGVLPPLALVSTGTVSGKVISDVSFSPQASFSYALFSDTNEGRPERQVHIIFSELPREGWRWEMESWAKAESLSYQKLTAGGKYWTVQIMPVTGRTDWFNALWQENGGTPPDFWLAKRWSARPEDEIRIVAEYREPAPLCMQKRLEDADEVLRTDKNAPMPQGKELWRNCDEAVLAFSARADAAVNLNGLDALPEKPLRMLTARPSFSPNMAKLVGRAEHLDFRDGNLPD